MKKNYLKDKEVERVVFNEITKKAVIYGIENPRQIEPLLGRCLYGKKSTRLFSWF